MQASVVFALVLTLVLTATVSLFSIAYFNHLEATMRHERFVAPPNEGVQKTIAAQEQLLTRRGWVDPSAGTARIPIEDAMKVIAARAAGKDGGGS